ncbi:hypothetical protein B0J17DRAFT_704531 [Rhizoctonia solani]|nr:hypothetical protein B0J17DRAFT_704531 [Rhizoctonia solani]
MAATKENPVIFYDLLSEHGPWSPNTYKTRLTLNYKRIPYRVEYVSFPDVTRKSEELGVKPTNPDGEIKYTLPMIADPSLVPNGKPTYVADSFNIAIYLDKTYPAPKFPAVFPPGMRAVQKITYDLFMKHGVFKQLPADTSIDSKFWGDLHGKWNWFGETLDLNEEDFAIGGIIFFVRRAEGGEMQMWKAMAEWQGGRWARHWAEIEKLEKDSSEVA